MTNKICIILVILTFVSCSHESIFFSLYTTTDYHENYVLLLNQRKNVYYYDGDCFEYGRYSFNKDTLILEPLYQEEGVNKIIKYEGFSWQYFIRNPEVLDKQILKRVYLLKENSALDITSKYYFNTDTVLSGAVFPLKKVKIKQTKDEKETIRARKIIDGRW